MKVRVLLIVTLSTSTDTKKGLFLKACRGEAVERVPVWMMRQAGRYLPEYRAVREKHSFLKVCKTPELAVEVSLQPYRILGVDAVIVFSDILIPAEAMGMALQLTDAGPLLPSPIRNAADLQGLRDFDPERETHFLMLAISTLCREVGPDVPVIGFAAAPWTLACYMVDGQTKSGFAATKQMMYTSPGVLRELLETIARNTARYLRAQITAGASAVQLFDTWAGELNQHDYEEFALPATQRIIEGLSDEEVPVILYTKGTAHLLPSLARAGADVLSLDWRVDLGEVRSRLGSRFALQGNVDPCVLLGPQEGIREAVQDVIGKTGGLGHILNLGHGILPPTPVENARTFIQSGQTCPLPKRAPATRAG
jgi:uroporphyrinogen decarboxylase